MPHRSAVDVVEGRTASAPAHWLAGRGQRWLARIQWAVCDLSGPHRATFTTMLPDAVQVADPLFRACRLSPIAHERLDPARDDKLRELLPAGDPNGEVAYARHAKEAVGFIHDTPNPDVADQYVAELARRSPRRNLPARGSQSRAHTHQIARPHRRVRSGPSHQRPRGSDQQPGQASEAHRVRVPQPPEPPDPVAAPHQTTQLGATGHDHTPLKSEEPRNRIYDVAHKGLGLVDLCPVGAQSPQPEKAMATTTNRRKDREEQVGAVEAARGPYEGFESWYFDSYPVVERALIIAAGDMDHGRDAACEAFARALESWGRVGQMANPSGWTYRVGTNWLRSRWRRIRREDDIWATHAPIGPWVDAQTDFDLWDSVRGLPRRQREVVALRYLLDLKERQVADVLGLRPGTVSRLLHDARSSLSTQLENRSTDDD